MEGDVTDMGAEKDRMSLLYKINEASFAMDEARLFLDTHPNCEEALAYYRICVR